MNYRHLFHAGNFADVFKHAALSLLLRALHKKETPFCYLETHAGAGRYDLEAPEAQRSGEYREGIARLWDEPSPPAPLADYLDIVRTFNPGGRLRFYPGSPCVAQRLMRASDRMVLCEKLAAPYAQLKAEFAQDARVAVHQRDGYEMLKALLPPTPRRGVVLLDPPYEQAEEFERIVAGLAAARERWATGVYAVWYPIKDRAAVARFLGEFRVGWQRVLATEFLVYPMDTAFRLNGCGLLLVNPPWGLDAELATLVQSLRSRLGQASVPEGSVIWLAQN